MKAIYPGFSTKLCHPYIAPRCHIEPQKLKKLENFTSASACLNSHEFKLFTFTYNCDSFWKPF